MSSSSSSSSSSAPPCGIRQVQCSRSLALSVASPSAQEMPVPTEVPTPTSPWEDEAPLLGVFWVEVRHEGASSKRRSARALHVSACLDTGYRCAY